MRYFYKKKPTDIIWWVEDTEEVGKLEFSFDKKKVFNAWPDYPYKLTADQKRIFDKENPYWASFFKDRT